MIYRLNLTDKSLGWGVSICDYFTSINGTILLIYHSPIQTSHILTYHRWIGTLYYIVLPTQA